MSRANFAADLAGWDDDDPANVADPDFCVATELVNRAIPLPAQGSAGERGPDYYRETGLQPWDAMAQWLPREQFIGFLRGNAIKYLARAGRKGDAAAERRDYAKALHYLEKLNEVLSDDDG